MPNWKKVIVSGSSAEITTLKATGLSGQSSEKTSLMINTSGVVGTRELGNRAFDNTSYIPTSHIANNHTSTHLYVGNGDGFIWNDTTNVMSVRKDGTDYVNMDAAGGTFTGNVIFNGEVTLGGTSQNPKDVTIGQIGTSTTENTSLMLDGNGVLKTRNLSTQAFSNYSLPAGSSSTRGGFKIGYTESGKNYPVEVSSEKMYVNVPWSDTDTNTQLSTAQVRAKFSAGDNVTIEDGIISSTDTDTNTQLSTAQVRAKFSAGTNVSITNGVISATDTNTDTNTVTSIRRDNTGTYRTGNINLIGGTNVTISELTSGQFTISSTDTNTDTNTQRAAGGGLTLSGNTLSHTNTSSQSSVNGSGRTYIQDITLDTYGHVTGLATATETVVNTDTNTQLSTAEVREAFSAGDNVTIEDGVICSTDTNTNTQLSTAQVRGKFSGNAINTSTGVITDTNTQLSDAQVRSKFSAGTNVSITSAGVISATDTNTQVTNNNQIANGAGYRTAAQVNTAIQAVVDSAPEALDTLNEIAASLNDDSDFAGTMTTALAGKLSTSGKAADSNLLDGLDLHTGRNNVANRVVRTNGSGYADFGWINTTSGATTGTISRVYCSGDGYIRYMTPTNFRNQIISAGTNVSISSTGVISSTDTNTNTQLSTAEVREAFSAGDNVTIEDGVICSTDTNTNTQLSTAQVRGKFSGNAINTSTGVITDTNTQLSDAQVRSKISGTGLISYNSSTGVISTTANNYSLPAADASTRGGIELFSSTPQSTAANSVSTTASRTYGLQINSAGQGVVNVPWSDTNTNTQLTTAQVRGKFSGTGINTSTGVITDTNTQLSTAQVRAKFSAGDNVTIEDGVITAANTNTTYSAGNGIGLSGTTFSVAAGTSLTQNSTGLSVTSNGIGATQLNVSGNGTTSQFLRSDGDGTFTWATPTDTNTQLSTSQVRGKFSGTGINTSTGVITDTNTQLSTEQVREAFSAGDNVVIEDGVITAGDTNTTYSAGSGIGLSGTTFSVGAGTSLSQNSTGLSVTSNGIGATQLNVSGNGTTAQFLRSDGDGSFSWATPVNTNTTYTADGNYGMTLFGTAFRLEDDRRRNSTGADIKTGNTHDYTFYDASHGIWWYTAGGQEMYLNNTGDLHVDGDVVAYSTSVSDERLKDNVTTIETPLDKIKALRGVEYDWNSGSRKGKHDLGLIAQEVEKVLPNIVHEHQMPLLNDDEEDETLYKTVDYEKLTAVLIEGMKEQQSQIDELKLEINKLKGDV